MGFYSTLLVALALTSQSYIVSAIDTLQVESTIGKVYGLVNGSTPDVAAFLGVPFAEPPTGSLRFMPPQKKMSVGGRIDATKIGPNCPQYPLTKERYPSVFTYDTPWLQPYGPWSEDCLTLNIWAPYKPQGTNGDPLPVIIWMFGGGFYEGGLLTLGMNPSNWVQRSQAHVVVAINYRNNIFGFPNSRYLAQEGKNLNMGLLDQRAAVEWVRDNIVAFGGDPYRMTLWGQSSGAASSDFFNYAYSDDPIVSGFIEESGSVFATGTSVDSEHRNFTYVAEELGCEGLSAKEEFACMQKNVSARAMIDLYENYNLNHTAGQLKWTTIVDNVTKFGDYSDRTLAGNYSKLPAIIGTNGNEQASLIAWPGVAGPNLTQVHEKTVSGELCPAIYTTNMRYKSGSKTFRYWNNASFPNISPRVWEGAYHTSELPLIFGTFSEYGGNASALEYATSAHWQDLYLAFMRDPENGLSAAGWPVWKPNGTVLSFGYNDSVSTLIPSWSLEGQCVRVEQTIV
ncbi:para-nitrobenzyl esterase [Thelonectria olida]|uniref:Carboxylic ester hydrolase n=1 Tax=Thelonectria olida TaxID=1576542 RepID=A0A9P8VR07_9HYPO|nr:para-nitrobenzyl esterase [Thelonectria olida]